jgi:hypothetical protein
MNREDIAGRIAQDPDVKRLRERRAELQERLRKAEEVVRDLEARREEASRQSGRERAISAILAGEDIPSPQAAPPLDLLAEARRNAHLLRSAIEVLARQVSEAEHKAGAALARELRPELAKAWEALARKAVEFSEEAAEMDARYDPLRAHGIPLGSIPMTALGWCNGASRYSRVNAWISEVEKDYGFKVPRPALEATEKRAAAEHEKELKRQAAAKKRDEAEAAKRRQPRQKRGRDQARVTAL